MKLTTLCLAIATALMISDCVHGQLLKNLFGGTNSNQSTPLGAEASALGQHASNLLGQQNFQLPGIPSLQQGNTAGQGGLGDLSNLIPKPQLPSFNPPNLLNSFNAKSKEMIDRTTEWARTKQQAFKEKSLGSMTKNNPLNFLNGGNNGILNGGNNGIASAVENLGASSLGAGSTTKSQPNYYAPPSTPLAQPPIRSAANPNGLPTVRF